MVNAALHSAGCSWGEQLNFRLSSRLSLSVISLSNYTFNFIFIFIVAWQDINLCTNNSYTLQLTVWRLEILSDLNTEKRKADGWSLWNGKFPSEFSSPSVWPSPSVIEQTFHSDGGKYISQGGKYWSGQDMRWTEFLFQFPGGVAEASKQTVSWKAQSIAAASKLFRGNFES